MIPTLHRFNVALARPTSTTDLCQSELRFLRAMHQLGYGRFEQVRVQSGELILDPWPKSTRVVKFCANAGLPDLTGGDFLLNRSSSFLRLSGA
jgi:hypothetical protein